MVEHNQSEKSIFLEAIEIGCATERAVFLDKACAGNPSLRTKVEGLVQAHDQPQQLLDASPPERRFDLPLVAEQPGTVIGPYKLLEQIGEGGFGIVFMADQTQPLRRKVALKVLKPGMDTRQVVARFEAERQALALMDHPNIAHVFDGGETVSGRPYFVMELVRGISITDFADQNHMPVRARLELFVNVCQAVQHAHQKGIIHRDLKPSNILVTLHDGTPVVKVIDFGIVKALGQPLTDKTLFTNFAQMIGTPMYMSPEQAEMSGLDVDTRSDIYSLGVLLYELLTGTTPFDKEKLRTASYDEMRRIIREEEPARPSTRMSTLGHASATVSANRQSDPSRLSQLLRGELDWIVMTAMEKDRNRRYESASAVAADVQRYLNDEQVLACPPSLGYRLRKLVRRHRGPLLAAALVVVVLVSGIVGTTWGLIRATDAHTSAVNEAKQKEQALQDREAALQDAKDKLYLALVSQARLARGSGRVGQRFETLKAIRQAAKIRITPELRAEAAAALVLPDIEVAQEWDGWPDDCVGVGFDAAFQRYVRLDKKGVATVCRLANGREEVVARLPAHGQPQFGDPCMSPDGRFVAIPHGSAGDNEYDGVRVWKLAGAEPAVLLDEPAGMLESLAFHPNGQRLAIGHPGKRVSVYDLANGRRLQRLKVSRRPHCLAFHPRHNQLAVGCDNNIVHRFDTDSGRELPPLRHPLAISMIYSVAWHPDGRRVAVACNDRKIYLWDTETATQVMPPWGNPSEGARVAFNHAGDRLVSCDWGAHTRLWDVATGQLLLTTPVTNGVQLSPDDRLLGIEKSGNKIKLSHVATGRELRVLRRRNAESLEVNVCPVVHSDGRTLAACTLDWLNFFDLANGEELAWLRQPQTHGASPVYFDPSGGWVTGGLSGLFLWPTRFDRTRPEVLCVGPAKQLGANLGQWCTSGTSASTDGLVVAVPDGSSIVVLHRSHPERRVLLGPQFDVRFTAVSPDGRRVVACSHWWDGRSNSVQIWDADTGKKVHELPLQGSTQARFSPDGRWLMTTTNGAGCRLWEVGAWREVRRYDRGKIAFSPDSRLLAVNDVLSVIRLIETATGREVARLTGPEPLWYHPECFTPDGTRLIATTSTGNAIYGWDLRLIRQQLKELGLDWDWDAFRPADPASTAGAPLKVEILVGDLAKHVPTREEKARQAIAQYRQAIDMKADDAHACNNLAWAYLTAPDGLRDLKTAVPLAEKAVELVAENAPFRNTLGVAYYRAGRYRDAVNALRPNLKRRDDKSLVCDLYFLSMSYQRLGETERARDYYDWAVHWTQAQQGLSSVHVEELSLFRTEAAKVLGIDFK